MRRAAEIIEQPREEIVPWLITESGSTRTVRSSVLESSTLLVCDSPVSAQERAVRNTERTHSSLGI
jgi:hypothetical protein